MYKRMDGQRKHKSPIQFPIVFPFSRQSCWQRISSLILGTPSAAPPTRVQHVRPAQLPRQSVMSTHKLLPPKQPSRARGAVFRLSPAHAALLFQCEPSGLVRVVGGGSTVMRGMAVSGPRDEQAEDARRAAGVTPLSTALIDGRAMLPQATRTLAALAEQGDSATDAAPRGAARDTGSSCGGGGGGGGGSGGGASSPPSDMLIDDEDDGSPHSPAVDAASGEASMLVEDPGASASSQSGLGDSDAAPDVSSFVEVRLLTESEHAAREERHRQEPQTLRSRLDSCGMVETSSGRFELLPSDPRRLCEELDRLSVPGRSVDPSSDALSPDSVGLSVYQAFDVDLFSMFLQVSPAGRTVVQRLSTSRASASAVTKQFLTPTSLRQAEGDAAAISPAPPAAAAAPQAAAAAAAAQPSDTNDLDAVARSLAL